MARISSAALTIGRDKVCNTVRPVVECFVQFDMLDLCHMKICKEAKLFKLTCKLWGDDGSLVSFNDDDELYTYTKKYYYPDDSINNRELAVFEVTIPEETLDEDMWAPWDYGRDEVYAEVTLENMYTRVVVARRTDVVKDWY